MKNVLWRAYLTILSVAGLALVIVLATDLHRHYKLLKDRKAVLAYYEQTYGPFVEIPDLKPPWDRDIEHEEPISQEQFDKMSKEELLNLAVKIKAKRKECLHDFLSFGYVPSRCQLTKELNEMGFNTYSHIWPWYDIAGTLVALTVLFGILLIRYWIAWLILGQRPKSFP